MVRMIAVVWTVFGLFVLQGCKSKCDRAADALEEKCGSAATEDADDSEACEADLEILADCVNANKDKTCAEIQAACYGQ